jgi:hypothetical protein
MSKTLVSVITNEIYDENNVRTDYLMSTKTLVLQDASKQRVTIDAGATDYALNIVKSGLEFIVIITTAPLQIKLNDIVNPAMVNNGQFVIQTSDVTAIYVTNPDAENAITIDIIQGNLVA